MKNILGLVLIMLVAFTSAFAQDQNNNDDVYYSGDDNPPAQTDQQYDDNGNPIDNTAPSYQEFYNQMSPYGNWMDYPGYGNVWVPSQVPADFQPYLTNGNWVYSDYGWTWASNYPWGWCTFHYGRWVYDAVYGWIWIPGYDWAPAWVVWGDYGGYYCWAPIGPGGYASAHYRPDARFWHFVPHGDIGHRDIEHAVIRNEDVIHNLHLNSVNEINSHVNIINHAKTYNQSVFFEGPKATEVEKYSGQKVNKVSVVNAKTPGATQVEGDHLNIYRPNIRRTTNQPAPAKVSRPEDVHPVAKPANQEPARQTATPERNTTPTRQVQPERQTQTWTPPRQSVPQQQPVRQPQSQPVQRQQPQPSRTFVPSERPAYSAPSYSAPRSSPSFSAPRGGGGGRR